MIEHLYFDYFDIKLKLIIPLMFDKSPKVNVITKVNNKI